MTAEFWVVNPHFLGVMETPGRPNLTKPPFGLLIPKRSHHHCSTLVLISHAPKSTLAQRLRVALIGTLHLAPLSQLLCSSLVRSLATSHKSDASGFGRSALDHSSQVATCPGTPRASQCTGLWMTTKPIGASKTHDAMGAMGASSVESETETDRH